MKMKNWIFVIVAIAFTANVYATEPVKMNIIALGDSKALVAAEKASPEKSVISIEAEDGHIVYYKESNDESPEFKTIFDLSNLNDGGYTVKFKSGNKLVKRDVEITKGEVSVEAMKTGYDPVFAMNGNVLKISYLNIDRGEMNLLVYNNGDLIYNRELGNDFNLQKGFDLSDLEKGEYDINLVASGEEYWFSVKK